MAFDDPRSKLYFEFERVLNEIKMSNPNVKFLLENVKMKEDYKNVISERLGVSPICINSKTVSAQNRYRLYWTNIEQPKLKDQKIFLKDILEPKVNDKYYIKGGRLNWLRKFGEIKEKSGYISFNPLKAKCLTARGEPSWNTTYVVHGSEVSNTFSQNHKYKDIIFEEGFIRKLTPIECERLQTLPDNYTQSVSDSQRYKTLGNSWTVDVIVEFFKNLK